MQPVGLVSVPMSADPNVEASPRKRKLTIRCAGSEVKVPMPRSWPELQHQAAQNFGHFGCIRLYHLNTAVGAALLYHPTQFNLLKDGDVVEMKRMESHRPVTPLDTPKVWQTTAQSDYRSRIAQRPAARVVPDVRVVLPPGIAGASLESESTYAAQFVVHAHSVRESFNPPSALELHDEPIASSSYSKEFSWRENNSKNVGMDHSALTGSSLLLASPNGGFEGISSYNTDFAKRKPGTPRSPMNAAAINSLKPPDVPFVPSTTYNTNYQKLGPGKQKSCRPRGQEYAKEPFLATTDYRDSYNQAAVTDTDY